MSPTTDLIKHLQISILQTSAKTALLTLANLQQLLAAAKKQLLSTVALRCAVFDNTEIWAKPP